MYGYIDSASHLQTNWPQTLTADTQTEKQLFNTCLDMYLHTGLKHILKSVLHKYCGLKEYIYQITMYYWKDKITP